jgi:hypothetical protein
VDFDDGDGAGPVTLADDVAAALPGLRAEAESLMVDTCRVTTPGAPVWNDTDGVYDEGAPVTLYEGKCRLRKPSAAPQTTDAGEASWAVDAYVLSLPVVGSSSVTDGNDVEMLTSANDPAAVGLRLTVSGGHWQTNSTARRLPCKVVTRDA